MKSLLVVGSIALDSLKTPAGEVNEILGGSATYFSCAASLFSRVRLVGVVGEDFPQRYVELLHDRDIDTAGLHVAPGETFRWTGHYGENLNEAVTVSVSLNVMGNFKPVLPEAYRDSEYVFLANIDPDVQAAVLDQCAGPRMVVCDTMNLWIETKRAALDALVRRVNVLVLNDGEARMYTGMRNLVEAGRAIVGMGPSAVIVKKGEHGVLCFSPEGIFALPAYPLDRVVDPTGAGDSFGGGLMGYLAACGDDSPAALRRAVVHGTVTASFAVEDFGTRRIEAIGRSDIESRIRDLRRLVSF